MYSMLQLLTCYWCLISPDLETGPAKGTALPTLKVTMVTGEKAGKELDTAREEYKPVAFIFLRSDRFDRPQARFLSHLDKEIVKAGRERHVLVIWLTDDVEKGKEYLPRVQGSLKLSKTFFSISADGFAGPPDWAINNDCHLSVIIPQAGKVRACFGYRSVNETDVPAVMKAMPESDQ